MTTKKTSQTILFFGTEDFSLTVLKKLTEAGFTIGAVITKPDVRRGRSAADTFPAIKQYALRQNIPVWQPTKLSEIAKDIQQFDSPAGVLVSYGKIISQSIIDLFAPGIINVHPSLLPLYRGPTPIESAILNGDTQTGVSIMQLSARMDAGPVYSQTTHQLTGSETKPQLYAQLADEGAEELARVLPSILEGSLTPVTQNENEATYCALLAKSDSLVNPKEHTATELERRIRAHIGFPKTRLPFAGESLIVTRAQVVQSPTEVTISCKNDTLLAINTLIAPSGKSMSADAYLLGVKNK